jgi:hypothetical protein
MKGRGPSLCGLGIAAVKLKRWGVETGRTPHLLPLITYSCLSNFAASVPQMKPCVTQRPMPC